MNQEGNIRESHGLWWHSVLCVILLLALLLCIPTGSAFAAKIDIPILGVPIDLDPHDDENWSYTLGDSYWGPPLYFDVIGLTSITDISRMDISASIDLSSSYEFDLTIKNPNITADDLKELKDPGSNAVKHKLYRKKVLDTDSFMFFFGFIPYANFTTDMVFEKYILAGANVPCRIKGYMYTKGEFKASLKDKAADVLEKLTGKKIPRDVRYGATFNITSVEPLDPDYDGMIYAYVGTEEQAVGGFGVIRFEIKKVGFKVGPVIDTDTHMNGWTIITAQQHKDEWDEDSLESQSSVHSCAKKGEKGCMSWTATQEWQSDYNWYAQIKLVVFKRKIIDFEKPFAVGGKYGCYNDMEWHQSRTFGENPAAPYECENHLYYPVPVYVWEDEDMRVPAVGAAVSSAFAPRSDSIMKSHTTGVTDEEGIATLWLPYSNIPYVLTASSGTRRGYSQSLLRIQKGENDPVNIVLGDGVPDVLSSYTVERYYQKNGVYPDTPDSSETRPGFIGDLAFLTEEDLTPDRERYELDYVKSAVHYGVVTEDGSLVLKAYFKPWYQVTFELNGGNVGGSTAPIVEKCYWGDEVIIPWGPQRDDFDFITWLGGEVCEPGSVYTVTGDHVFTAVWLSSHLGEFWMSYDVTWDGEEDLDHVKFRLFSDQGEYEEWCTASTSLGDNKSLEVVYLPKGHIYYVTVEPEEGYIVTIQNTGSYAGIMDRCYTGGHITIRKKVPKTGDEALPFLWIGLMVTGILGIGALTAVRRRR